MPVSPACDSTVTDITILIPVLGRPERAREVVASIKRGSTTDPQVIFVCSPEDTEQHAAVELTGAMLLVVDWEPGPGDYAKKINHGLQFADGGWVFTGADDLCFCEGWDTAALEMGKTGVAVVGTDDLWNPSVRAGAHSTHSLVDVGYARNVGLTWDGRAHQIYCPEYDHQCVDNELVAVAKQRAVWGFAKQSKVEHLHPFAHKGEMDPTYQKGLARGRQDIELFKQRKARYG